jgi:hypothetical protein
VHDINIFGIVIVTVGLNPWIFLGHGREQKPLQIKGLLVRVTVAVVWEKSHTDRPKGLSQWRGALYYKTGSRQLLENRYSTYEK